MDAQARGPSAQRSLEFSLLCACLHARPSPEVDALVARRWRQADERQFLELAVERHRVGPLVHDALSRRPHWPASAETRNRLATVARHNALQTLRGERHLALLGGWLAEHQVPWLAFKGIAVARRYYEQPALRHWNDTDVWVPPASLPVVRQVLASKGYRCDPEAAAWDLSARGPRHRRFVESYVMEELHVHPEYGAIDLHWAMTDNPAAFRLSPQAMHAKALHLDVAGQRLPTLNDLDHLLYLCEHGSRHHWARLKWLADLPRILDHTPWDWPELQRQADRASAHASLVQAMRLSRDLLGWEPPGGASAVLETRRYAYGPERVAVIAMNAPLQWTIPGPGPLSWRAKAAWARIFCPPNWPAARELLRVLSLAPGDLRVFALPDRLFPLYRLLRPLLFVVRRLQAATTGH